MNKHSQNLIILNKSFEQELKNQKEFYISVLTHDLQIPTLAQIKAIELLMSEKFGKLTNEQREMLDLTLNSCKYMNEMITNVINAYKYEDNEISLDFEHISISQLLDESFSKCMNKMLGKNIRVLASDINYFLLGDKTKLSKAFDILIDFVVSNSSDDIKCKIESYNGEILITFEFLNIGNIKKFNKVGVNPSLYLAEQIMKVHKGCLIFDESSFIITLPYINQNTCEFNKNVV